MTVTILDGGMGHELKLRGIVTDGSFLARIVANISQPEAVERVHADFLRSGCDVVTTNSFVAVAVTTIITSHNLVLRAHGSTNREIFN